MWSTSSLVVDPHLVHWWPSRWSMRRRVAVVTCVSLFVHMVTPRMKIGTTSCGAAARDYTRRRAFMQPVWAYAGRGRALWLR